MSFIYILSLCELFKDMYDWFVGSVNGYMIYENNSLTTPKYSEENNAFSLCAIFKLPNLFILHKWN